MLESSRPHGGTAMWCGPLVLQSSCLGPSVGFSPVAAREGSLVSSGSRGRKWLLPTFDSQWAGPRCRGRNRSCSVESGGDREDGTAEHRVGFGDHGPGRPVLRAPQSLPWGISSLFHSLLLGEGLYCSPGPWWTLGPRWAVQGPPVV